MSGPQEFRLRRSREQDREKENDLVIPATRKEILFPPTPAPAPAPSVVSVDVPTVAEFDAQERQWDFERSEYIARLEDNSRQIEFLKDQVKRANVELSRYQAKYPTIPKEQPLDEKSLGENDPLPAWLISSHFLTPLMTAYDDRLHELQLQCDDYRSQVQILKKRAEVIVEENDRLNNEVKSHLETLLRREEEEDLKANTPGYTARVSVEDWDGLQDYSAQLSHENETLSELVALQKKQIDATSTEARRLELENQDLVKMIEEMKIDLEERDRVLQDMRNERLNITGQLQTYVNEVESARRERDRTQSELKKLRDDLVSSNTRLPPQMQSEIGIISRGLETIITRPTQIIVKESKEQELWAKREREFAIASEAVEQELNSLRTRHRQTLAELQQKTKECQDLMEASIALERRITDGQQREVSLSMSEQAALELVEEAKLERDQALKREEQSVRECARLTEKIKLIQSEFREKIDAEVASVTMQNKAQNNALVEEIKALELSVSDMQGKMERAVREKRAAESELEKFKRAIPEYQQRQSQVIEEINSQLRHVERERDENAMKIESAQNNLRIAQGQISKLKAEKESIISEINQKIVSLEVEIDSIKSEKTKVVIQLEETQKQLRIAIRERDDIVKRSSQEKNSLTSYYDEQVRSLEQRLNDAHADRERLYRELEKALNDRDRVMAKSREDIRVQTHRHEGIISDLKSDLSRVVERYKEAQTRNEDLRIERIEKDQLIDNLHKSIQQLHVTNDSHERHISDFQNQIVQILAREEDLLKERKELLRRIDRLNLERDRSNREFERVSKKCAEIQIEMEREILLLEGSQIRRSDQEFEEMANTFLNLSPKKMSTPVTKQDRTSKGEKKNDGSGHRSASRSASEASERAN